MRTLLVFCLCLSLSACKDKSEKSENNRGERQPKGNDSEPEKGMAENGAGDSNAASGKEVIVQLTGDAVSVSGEEVATAADWPQPPSLKVAPLLTALASHRSETDPMSVSVLLRADDDAPMGRVAAMVYTTQMAALPNTRFQRSVRGAWQPARPPAGAAPPQVGLIAAAKRVSVLVTPEVVKLGGPLAAGTDNADANIEDLAHDGEKVAAAAKARGADQADIALEIAAEDEASYEQFVEVWQVLEREGLSPALVDWKSTSVRFD